jgi:asparagine synthetase B (glutamine-hydrolysing)
VRPWLALPQPLRAALSRAPIAASAAARRVLAHGTGDARRRYALWHEVANSSQLAALLRQHSEATARVTPTTAPQLDLFEKRHPLDQFLWLESQTRMIDFINVEVDRMSMANSVEARPPFLDHELWEFCAALPPECKLSPQGNKLLLRNGMRGHLPPAVLNQPKRGLATPHSEWWRAERLPAWAEECLHPTALAEAGYFDARELQRLRELQRSRRAEVSRLLMGILTAQLWHAEFAHA